MRREEAEVGPEQQVVAALQAGPGMLHALPASGLVGLQRAVGNSAAAAMLKGTGGHQAAPLQRDNGGSSGIVLSARVGRGGRNQAADVRAVQSRLQALGFLRAEDRQGEAPDEAVETVPASRLTATILAIRAFQKERAYLRSPDGRVDPGGSTLAALNREQPSLENTVERVAGSITGVFEGGRPDTLNLYDNGIISYGKHQATLAAGNLYHVLRRFCDTSESDGAGQLAGYLDRVQRRDQSLREDQTFIQLLRDVAFETAMLAAQEHVFRQRYWEPSQRQARGLNITTPLGRAFLYDTQIHGGLQSDIRAARERLGGVPGDTVGDAQITEHQFVLAMIENRAARNQRAGQRQVQAAGLLEQAAAAETEAERDRLRTEAQQLLNRRQAFPRQPSALRRVARQQRLNGQALIRGATETRIPMWRQLAESGDWNLAGGAGGFLTVRGQPVVGLRGAGRQGTGGTQPREAPARPPSEAAEPTTPAPATRTEGTAGGAEAGSELLGGLAVGLVRTILSLLAGVPLDQAAVRGLIAMGVRDETDLTNLLFWAAHPEAAFRRIRPGEDQLAQAWLRIRDTVVRPALGGGTPQPAPAAGPQAPQPAPAAGPQAPQPAPQPQPQPAPQPQPVPQPAPGPGGPAGPAPASPGPTVAVTAFDVANLGPLLARAARSNAVRWTADNHPRTSGVTLAQLRGAVGGYISLQAVEEQLTAAGEGATPDDVLVEAIHQFQLRTYADRSQHDGKAGPSTLDSLGLLARTGLTPVRRANTAARRVLNRIDRELQAQTEFTAATWFDGMMNPSFLGRTFSNGIHKELAERFRIAERHLLGMDAYRSMSPTELGDALGINEQHKGARPTAESASMHTFGLAADINYRTNPWIAGQSGGGAGNAAFVAIFQRASRLVDGASHTLDVRYLSGLSGRTTDEIVTELGARNTTFRTYLRLGENATELEETLERRRAAGTEGVFERGESVAQARQRWTRLIAADLRNLTTGASNFSMGRAGYRDPRQGFFNLHRDLVVALRDVANLAWGATDFGSRAGGSGDIMHFDHRREGIGAVIGRARVRR